MADARGAAAAAFLRSCSTFLRCFLSACGNAAPISGGGFSSGTLLAGGRTNWALIFPTVTTRVFGSSASSPDASGEGANALLLPLLPPLGSFARSSARARRWSEEGGASLEARLAARC